MGETITFKRPDGKEAAGYCASAGDNAPGMVVIQEWWGVNDQIKGVADKLAGLGYTSVVPDLYKGVVTVEAEEASHLMQNLDFADANTDGRRLDRAGGGVLQGRGRGVLLVRRPSRGSGRHAHHLDPFPGPLRARGRLLHPGQGGRPGSAPQGRQRHPRDLPLPGAARVR